MGFKTQHSVSVYNGSNNALLRRSFGLLLVSNACWPIGAGGGEEGGGGGGGRTGLPAPDMRVRRRRDSANGMPASTGPNFAALSISSKSGTATRACCFATCAPHSPGVQVCIDRIAHAFCLNLHPGFNHVSETSLVGLKARATGPSTRSRAQLDHKSAGCLLTALHCSWLCCTAAGCAAPWQLTMPPASEMLKYPLQARNSCKTQHHPPTQKGGAAVCPAAVTSDRGRPSVQTYLTPPWTTSEDPKYPCHTAEWL